MTMEQDPLSEFRDSLLDYLDGDRDDVPSLERLSEPDRSVAEGLIRAAEDAAGIDPYASRPSVEQLLAGIRRGRRPAAELATSADSVVAQLHETGRRHRLAEVIPLGAVLERGWIADGADAQVEAAACELLEISDVDQQPGFAAAARRSSSGRGASPAETAWLGRIRQIARAAPAQKYDRRKLAIASEQLPRLLQAGPAALPQALATLASCGVRVVFCEGLQGGKLMGAVTFLQDGGPVIGLTTRGDRFDSVVFTLLHECAHLILGHIDRRSGSLLDDEPQGGAADDPHEIAANEQASAWLFPDGFDLDRARRDVDAAAREHAVHPSCVAGRIEYEAGDWSLLPAYHCQVRGALRELGLLSD